MSSPMCDALLQAQAGEITRHTVFLASNSGPGFCKNLPVKQSGLPENGRPTGVEGGELKVESCRWLLVRVIVCLRSLSILVMVMIVYFFLPFIQLLFLVIIQNGPYL